MDCTYDIRIDNKTLTEEAKDEGYKFPLSWFHFIKNDVAETYINTGFMFDMVGKIISIFNFTSQAGNRHKEIELLDDTKGNTIILWPDIEDQEFLESIYPETDTIIILTAMRVTEADPLSVVHALQQSSQMTYPRKQIYFKKCCFHCETEVRTDEYGNAVCPRCKRINPRTNLRYVLYADVEDWTGNIPATLFNDVAEKVLGYSVSALLETFPDADELQKEITKDR